MEGMQERGLWQDLAAVGVTVLCLSLAACSDQIDEANNCTDIAEFVLEADMSTLSDDEWLRLATRFDELRYAAVVPDLDEAEVEICDRASDLAFAPEPEIAEVFESHLRELLADG